MTMSVTEPIENHAIKSIYDLKPLQHSGHAVLELHTFFVMIFSPQKIKVTDLKTWLNEAF